MDLLGKKLKQQKELREKAARKPRRKQEYTPVEVDTGLDDERGGFENDPEPGEETSIKMKPRSKPLPLPPSPRPEHASSRPSNKSPKPSHGIKQRNSIKSPSDLTSKNDSGRFPNQPQAGVALMQELAKKKQIKSTVLKAAGGKDTYPSTNRKSKDTKPLPSIPSTGRTAPSLPPVASAVVQEEPEGESEPMYANTFTADATGSSSYQNCDFSGPPGGATPISSGATPISSGTTPISSGATPISSGATPISSGATPISSGARPTSAPGGAPGEYQNINFGVQKPQTKKKPKTSAARSPNVAAKNHTHPHTSHAHSSAGGAQANGSVAGNSAGEYQNFQFGGPKK